MLSNFRLREAQTKEEENDTQSLKLSVQSGMEKEGDKLTQAREQTSSVFVCLPKKRKKKPVDRGERHEK